MTNPHKLESRIMNTQGFINEKTETASDDAVSHESLLSIDDMAALLAKKSDKNEVPPEYQFYYSILKTQAKTS